MPEVQTSTQSGEMTQRFIELVMMQAQQAAMFLGRMPNPQSGQPEVNLEFARLFIDQLEMLQEKTRGNLSNEESKMLGSVLSDLQLSFVQTSAAPPATASQSETPSEPIVQGEPPADTEQENRKRFSKSYGS
jgi:hypothetical protein